MLYEKLLEEIGLTRGEIAVYLSLLKHSPTTTGKIIREAGISSGKIYEILDKLVKKGLVGYIVQDKVKHFSAARPERILDYLKEKETKLQTYEEKLKEIMPQLTKLQTLTEKDEATIYKGFRGIQTAANEALIEVKCAENLAMGVTSRKDEKYNKLWREWHKQRIKTRLKCRILFSEKGTAYYRFHKELPYTEVRVLEGITPAATTTLGSRTLIFNYQEPSCVVITSQPIADSFTHFFYTLWKIAKP